MATAKTSLASPTTIEGPDAASKSPSPPPQPNSSSADKPQIHTYHCVCLTHILTTPYALPSLPTRAAPSLDKARILPLPSLDSPSSGGLDRETYLPSLLHNLRPARKAVVVQREDGWERRRVWRCGRCGCVVGYEIEGAVAVDGKRGETGESLKVMYLLEGGLISTENMINMSETGGGTG